MPDPRGAEFERQPFVALNALAVDLAAASLDTDPVPLVVSRLRLITGAFYVSYSEYDPADASLHLRRSEADGAILARVNQILGYVLGDLKMPVSADLYREMLGRRFHRVPDLSTLTLGAVSAPLAATLERVFGIGEKIVLVFQREGRLFGTAGLLMPESLPQVPDAVLDFACSMVSAALSRHVAEQRLLESEERVRTIFDAVSDAIFVHDPETGDVLDANARASEMFGHTVEALRQSGVAPLCSPTGEFTPERALAHIRAAASGQPQLFLWQCRHRDGSVFWAEGHMRRISLAGSPRVLVTLRDVTARRRAESEQERADEAANQAQRLEAIGRLAGGVAHEFNNLLTAIIGNVDLVLEDLGAGHPVSERLREAMKAADTAASLTAQLLAFGRRQMISPRVTDLNAVATTAVGMLARALGGDVTVVMALADDAWPVRIDPMQFQQVIVNLAVTARDAMPNGGRLSIETANVVLDEAFVRTKPWAVAGRYVRLSVTDTGAGMPPGVLEHAFEPFYTSKVLGQGTGLGLAMVYGAAKQNHGVIDIESEVGHGTTVRIYLPAAA